MSQLPTAIRKAAILVSTLDDQAADALLAQMGPEMAARVRNAMMELVDIAADEQKAVLAEFLHGGAKANPTANDLAAGGVEFDESLLARIDEAIPSAASPALPTSRNPFDFLASVPPRSVAEVLAREQPQTIAVVVARLSPDLAAQLLETLPPALATDVLERMAWLDEPAEEVLADLAQQLRRDLAPSMCRSPDRAQSLAGLHAVLGAMDGQARSRVLAGLAARNRSLSRQLGHQQPAGERMSPASQTEVVSFRYRLERPEQRLRPGVALVDFDDFTTFSDDAIRRIFAAAEPQIVLLALTGADEMLLARIVRQLPPRAAAAFRARLNHPGAVRLRDIESAREQLADLARRLAEQGVVVLPGSRHFAAAA